MFDGGAPLQEMQLAADGQLEQSRQKAEQYEVLDCGCAMESHVRIRRRDVTWRKTARKMDVAPGVV
jgi:hypothetical protein